MRKFYKKAFRFLFIIPLLLISILNARADLSPGDLAVIGMNSDVDAAGSTIRSFAVVALNTIAKDEVIFITDRGWVNPFGSSPGSFTTNTTLEGAIQWKPSVAVPAGTVIIFKVNMASATSKTISAVKGDGTAFPSGDFSIALGWTNAIVTSLPWNNTTGDQLLIYQGSTSNPSFIFAFNNVRTTGTSNNSGGWFTNPTGAPGSNTGTTSIIYSEIPSTLSASYAVGFISNSTTESRYPNEIYVPSLSKGTKTEWLADITNKTKWTNTNVTSSPFNFSQGFGADNATQFTVGTPTVTAAKISISGANGTGGAFKIGDVVTATWDNTASGDNNSGVTDVTVNFSQFGGGTAVTATSSSNTWAATYTIIAGTVDAASRNVSVTATNTVGPTTTDDDANATVDNITPTVVISSTAGATGGSTGTSPIPFTVTFSEAVTGFVAGDITPGNATISGFSGSGTTYTFNATPTANGAVTINISANIAQDDAGNGNTAASQFSITYGQAVSAPTVTALSPTSGPASGGNTVTITGTNFSGATAVTFGATAATGFTVNSATQITATAPAGTGTVDVSITTTGGTSATSASDQFTYVAAPTVTALSPTSGPTSGGNTVTITGTNFSGATAVTFGATAATGFTVNSATQITATAPAGIGTIDVRITTTGGTSATSASDRFTYVAAPTVTALSPTSGPASGGTTVTITGTNFSGTTAVTFGATAATGFTVNSATQITATAPAGTGTVDVRITTAGGISATSASDQFTYVAAPTVTALNPTSGPASGGTSVTITGTNFSGATAVTFGATAATGFTVNSATQITATAPAGTGTVDVRITTTGGTSATSANDQFTYLAAPTLTAISPTSGPASGGTSVTITGTNFSRATAVTFGATAATGFTVNSATQITATAPAGTGTVDVRITTTGGTSATSASDQFTYIQASQITASAGTFPSALSTTYGTASTSTSVAVSGTGLTAGITATPSSTANFEVSADGISFGTSAIIGTSGTVLGTVYVRLKATATANTNITGNITLTSTGTNSPVITIPTSAVAQRVITVTAAAKSKTYGDADPALTYTSAPSLVTGDSFNGSLSRLPGENVGTYAINQGTLALSSNYTLTYVGADLTIGAKTVTVTAAAKSKTYGDADPALTYTSAPSLVTGDSFNGSLSRLPGENVGTCAINQGTLALNGNYTLTYVGANLTIGAKTITVTATAKSKTYGDADPALTYTSAPSLVTGDSFSGSLSRLPGENVGTYAINQGTLALNGNYTLTYVGADLTIGAKTVTVTAAAKSKTYGDADPALTYTSAPSLVTGDSFSGSLSRLPSENVGTYAINQGTLALNGNYTLTYVGADLTIGAKTVTVTAAAKSKTYGDADPALTYNSAPSLVTGDSFSGSLSRSPGENVGTYAINQGTLALNGNYTLTYVGANLTIGAKTITVTAAAKSKTYGDADPTLTYTFAPALTGTDTFTGSLTRLPGENVGTYAINQGTLALNGNYTLTYVGADLTIDAKTVTVTAATKSKTYGDADPALTYTFAPALTGTDTFTGSLSRSPGENVGTYAINQGTLALNGNYALTYVGANLTIGAKTITVTSDAKSKTFGDADPALTYTFAPNLATGDAFTGSLTRLPGENVGTYAINQGTLALNTNYALTYIGANLTIGTKTITVTAAAKSKTFGDADPALTYTFAPALSTGDSFSGSLTRAVGENVGTYALNQGTLALNGNYALTYVGADLTIGAKTITVTAAAKSKTFGDADPALNYTFAPTLQTGDAFTGSLTRLPGENVGAYAINQGTLALSSNYNLTYVGADLTIGAKTITVTAAAKSKTYGDADPALTYTFAPALTGTDTFTGSLSRSPGENVGTYAINQGTLALNGNYTLTYVGADLTIGAKTVTVTAAAKSKTYGDADPALTYTFAPALTGTDTFTGSLSRSPGENVGTYAINQGTLALNGNYTLTYVGGNLTIGAKTITVTAAAKSKTYGDADPVLTYTFTPTLIGTDTFTGSLTRLPGENVGTYTINQGTLALNGNYTLTYVGADLTIGVKTVTVTAAAKSKTYGDADPVLTYTFAPALTGTDTFAGSLTRSPGENVGTYAINQGTLALNGNYTLTYVSADLTIGAKTVTVTAAVKSKTYGDADPALSYTFTPTLTGTDTFTGSLSRLPGENVGTYAINQGTLALNGNYTLTYVSADLTIGAKTITVTAAAKSKTYGDADPALTYTFAPALQTGDSFSGSLTRAVSENVGMYAINQGTLALNGNYVLTYVGANLTIGAKTITLTAAAKSKTYGDADPALTYTFAPTLTGTDTFTGSLSRSPGENVGTYAINQGTLALNGNYALTYVGADLTIGAKTVTVTAAAKSKTYGDADPALTYTFAPALTGTDTFTGSLTRSPGENVGTYAINQGTLALDSNYTLTYVGADLTIGAKTVTVTAAAKSKTYGDADPALTYTFAPALQTGDAFTGSLTRAVGENVGTYAINQGTLALSSNYVLTYAGANLTIGAKTITVTAAAKSKTYGDADPALTYTFAPALQPGDAFTGSLTRLPGENVGTYAISQGTLAINGNYALNYIGADLMIGAKTITVTAAAKSKTFGDADPALTYTFAPALQTGDAFTGSLTRLPGENVGTYAINQGTLALSSNYVLTYIGANLTIGAKTITITAAAKSKTFGDVDPALTYTFAPALATGDSFSGSLNRLPGEAVGTYAITQGTLTLNRNYTLTYNAANLTITARVITITAIAKSKTYGDADPALTYTFSPALPTGTVVTGSLTRAAGENAGTYAINQGSLTLSGNYTVAYAGADLTINKAVLTVSANNAVMCQSDGFPNFGIAYNGFKAGDTENSLSTKPTVSTTANRNVTGTYVLVPSNGGSGNYTFVYVNGSLVINALPQVNILSNNGTSISKGETAILTASGGTSYSWSTANGIISGQNTASLTVRPSQTTVYTVRVTNASGCSRVESITIQVAEDYKIVANNILTPNGDGVNDTWIVKNIDMYPSNDVRIFDRNGREMYSKKSYDNSWDGTLRGIPLAEGTYYYIITYGPDKLVQKGFITIIRNR